MWPVLVIPTSSLHGIFSFEQKVVIYKLLSLFGSHRSVSIEGSFKFVWEGCTDLFHQVSNLKSSFFSSTCIEREESKISSTSNSCRYYLLLGFFIQTDLNLAGIHICDMFLSTISLISFVIFFYDGIEKLAEYSVGFQITGMTSNLRMRILN